MLPAIIFCKVARGSKKVGQACSTTNTESPVRYWLCVNCVINAHYYKIINVYTSVMDITKKPKMAAKTC